MPMPKGHKSSHGYSTNKSFDGGEDYRTIADKMTKSGHKMNHATARNVFLSALTKIAAPINKMQSSSSKCVNTMVKDPRFQEGVAAILSELNVKVR